MPERHYGVSLITLLPYSLGKKGARRAWKIAWQSGLGLQLVPFASLSTEGITALPPEAVISYEGAWSNTPFTLSSYINSIIDHKDAASIAEPFLFGFRRDRHEQHKKMVELFSQKFPHALPIDVDAENSLKEISPNHPWTLSHYLNTKAGLVLDTWHIRQWHEKHRRDEPLDSLIKSLLPKIRLIQFQTRDDTELQQFLTLNGPLLPILEVLRDTPKTVPIVIELHPKYRKVLDLIRKRIQLVLG